MSLNFIIPIENHFNDPFLLTSKQNTPIFKNYSRIVIGKRGPYVETTEDFIFWENIYVPKKEEWRLNSNSCFYNEYRSKDQSYVKIYHQKETVAYADYKIGFFYVSPDDLFLDGKNLIKISDSDISSFF